MVKQALTNTLNLRNNSRSWSIQGIPLCLKIAQLICSHCTPGHLKPGKWGFSKGSAHILHIADIHSHNLHKISMWFVKRSRKIRIYTSSYNDLHRRRADHLDRRREMGYIIKGSCTNGWVWLWVPSMLSNMSSRQWDDSDFEPLESAPLTSSDSLSWLPSEQIPVIESANTLQGMPHPDLVLT